MVVAREAPYTPRSNPQENIKTGFRSTLRAAPVITATEEILTEDSARAAQFKLWAGRLKRAAKMFYMETMIRSSGRVTPTAASASSLSSIPI